MNFSTLSERLLTWLDVERQLKQRTALWTKLPEGIHAVHCFSDGMDIEHSAPLQIVHNWLLAIFGKAYDEAQASIRLRIADTQYPVSLEKVPSPAESVSTPGLTYPLWREVTYLPDSSESPFSEGNGFKQPEAWVDGPRMVSFHSFKGGVGRTTALMTYVAARLQLDDAGPVKLLVVDADLEAPGVTFWLDAVNQPQVSFVQFLEAMHFPPSSIEKSLDFFAQSLRKTSLNVGGTQRELFVLPAALELTDIEDMPVQPGHLAKNPQNPWILTDHLHALGKKLGADAVFLDLRAGLSELASPILFDPRVEHFFVTTVAKQSIQGMAEVLKRLHAFNACSPVAVQHSLIPSVVLSMVTDELRKSSDYSDALETLGAAYPPPVHEESMASGLEWLEVVFSPQLMSVGSLRQALDVLKHSSLYANARDWAASLQQTNISRAAPRQITERKEKAKKLHDVCTRVQFAEKEVSADMLVTEPLRNIGKHFTNELPSLVSVGAKGAGKTFTFLQMCQAQSWYAFLRKVDVLPTGVSDALIFPCLWSSNLEKPRQSSIQDMRNATLQKLKVSAASKRMTELGLQIDLAIKQPPAHWDIFWDEFVCQQFGVTEKTLSQLNSTLIEKNQSIVLMFDGLEDAFDDPTNKETQDAIYSLLRLPNRLAELSQGRIGVLIFVRVDYVQSAINQNVAQFLSRYAPFQLHWNPESFLRLAYWLCAQAGILDNTASQAQTLPEQGLLKKLENLWGKKLGNDTSKEALSARWVFASLCDLKGNIQARDLVRFLKVASGLEKDRLGETWPHRVLAPESMRKAIPMCSQEKVTEAAIEIAPLKSWMAQLAQITGRKQIPFDAQEMGLDIKALQALQELGVIFEDRKVPVGEPRLYLPEIYRTGLNFETSTAGRPRTQALLKSNLGVLPF
ncbi:MAG: hypothetical protein RLZZ352_2319 [Pseudomonadota bacterium]|jgi:MinD-like ATPase involved in chromosome partitioning or flagellar assembly